MDHRTVNMLVGLLFIMGSAAGIVVAVAGPLADRAKS